MQKIWLLIALLFVLNGVDYANLGDIVNDGKSRYLLLSLCPVVFAFFRARLGFAPAFVGALSLASWTLHDFKTSHALILPVISILAVLAISCAFLELGEELFAKALTFSGFLQASIAILQCARAAHILPFGFWHHALPDALIGQNTLLAAFLAVCACPALWRGKWIAFAVISAGIFACQSVGGIACLFLILAIRLLRTQDWPLAFVMPFLFAICSQFIFHRNPLDSDGRFFIWGFGWRALREHLWFGSGIGAWENIFRPQFREAFLEQFQFHSPRALHNDYLDFAVEYGIAPLAVLFASLCVWLKNFRASWPNAVCAVGLVDALFSFPASQIYMAVPFLVCFRFSSSFNQRSKV